MFALTKIILLIRRNVNIVKDKNYRVPRDTCVFYSRLKKENKYVLYYFIWRRNFEVILSDSNNVNEGPMYLPTWKKENTSPLCSKRVVEGRSRIEITVYIVILRLPLNFCLKKS